MTPVSPSTGDDAMVIDVSERKTPWQVQAVTLLGDPKAWAGMLGLVAVYLVYVLAGTVSVESKTTNQLLREHMTVQSQQQLDVAAVLRVLTATCVNAAADSQGRERCFR
jgi:hypothetical protein